MPVDHRYVDRLEWWRDHGLGRFSVVMTLIGIVAMLVAIYGFTDWVWPNGVESPEKHVVAAFAALGVSLVNLAMFIASWKLIEKARWSHLTNK